MISSTTLILATLVFNAVSIFGAPIRIPSTVPEVEARAPVPLPIIHKLGLGDAQPPSGQSNPPRRRLAREDYETRATASESVEMRDSLPEVEEIVRRYPRRHLAEFYEKRSPEPVPAPDSPSAPSPQVEARSEPAPPVERRFPRRALFERHERRAAAPAPPVQARNEHDPDGHFVRAHNPELMAKRDAIPTDNVPREPEPAPAPSPAKQSEVVRRYPRRVYAEYYEKRQDTQDQPTPAGPPDPKATSTTTPTSAPPTTPSDPPTTPSNPATTSSTLPASLEKAIADAIVRGSSNVGTEISGTKNSYSDTTITIKITHQANSDVKPSGTSTNPTPTSPPSTPPASGSPSSTPSGTPTGDSTTPPPEGSSTGSTTTGDDSSNKPEDKSKPPKATATGTSSSGTPDGGASASQPDAEPRDLGNSDASVEPLTKRKLGLSGALWASWNRRNSQN